MLFVCTDGGQKQTNERRKHVKHLFAHKFFFFFKTRIGDTHIPNKRTRNHSPGSTETRKNNYFNKNKRKEAEIRNRERERERRDFVPIGRAWTNESRFLSLYITYERDFWCHVHFCLFSHVLDNKAAVVWRIMTKWNNSFEVFKLELEDDHALLSCFELLKKNLSTPQTSDTRIEPTFLQIPLFETTSPS